MVDLHNMYQQQSIMGAPAERQLVDAAMAGERDAFAVLVERYQRLVIASATAILGDRHAAQDVAQEAFVTAYEKLATLRSTAAFGPWIMRIARREAYRVARRARRLQPIDSQGVDGVADSNGRLDDESWELLRLVERLPEHERVVVMLKYFDGYAVGDIASMTGQTVGTVTKKLSRARKRLQSWLERNDR